MKALFTLFAAMASIVLVASCHQKSVDDGPQVFGESLKSDVIHLKRIDGMHVAMPYVLGRRMGVIYLRGEFSRGSSDKAAKWSLRSASDALSLLNCALGEGKASDSLRAAIIGHVGKSFYEREDQGNSELLFLDPNGRNLVLVAISPAASPERPVEAE